MSKRSAIRFGIVAVLVIAVIVGATVWWTRPRIIEAGAAVILVQGRDLGLGVESMAGVGVEGTIDLIGGTCVGLIPPSGRGGAVIVWPPGTQVRGSGDSLSITSQGVTVHIGDGIDDAGTQHGLRFPEFEEGLPEECQGSELMDLHLGG
jgi:hypothetical protein